MVEGQEVTTWKEVIATFLSDKYEADLSKFLKSFLKEIDNLYEAENYFDDEELITIFDNRKSKKAEEQKETDFLIEKFEKLQKIHNKPEQADFQALGSELHQKKQELLDKYSPQVWLSTEAGHAKNVTFATHVAKLSHSVISSPSFIDEITATKDGYLTTSSLSSAAIDGAVTGNQYAPVYQFLELELKGKKLADEFQDLETDVLSSFAENETQKLAWNEGFAASLHKAKPEAHFLLKQVYFPVDNEEYHLLCNIVSSSMAQALFEFSRQNTNETFKSRKDKKYSNNIYFNFPGRAHIAITASNHGNASQFNGRRGGRLGLYSCEPPLWKSTLKPPVYTKSFFYELSGNYIVQETIQFLADFLVRFETLQLSIKDPKRMRWVEEWVETLTDEVLVYVKTIQALPAGWSLVDAIKLKSEHQLLLDCSRRDEEFMARYTGSNWQAVIGQDFASWLNDCLNDANKEFTPQEEHKQLWVKLFEANLREMLQVNVSVQGEGEL